MTEPDHEELTKTEARGAETPHIGRYVLLISTLLIVVAFGVMLVFFS
ncbi:MAG: hypothetical protein WA906_06175 [Pacificimonas sp.]